tara:strand:- start:45 stop:1127 length:1083 start_codon:yes stop_codon:yes gene_type:complete
MIIGVTGTYAAGKGEIVNILVEKGFKHYSVRGFLEKELMNRGLSIDRDHMINLANELRERFGSSYLAEKLYELAQRDGGDVVIESLRNPGEIMALRAKKEFYLMAVDADPKIRYSRIPDRASSTDSVSFEKFIEQETREMESEDPNKQNLNKCISMSEIRLENNGSIGDLKIKVEKVLNDIQVSRAVKVENNNNNNNNLSKKHVRPTWDEYFMSIADITGSRGTCDRGRAGCVIVRDKHILVGGYAGSPKGLPHCDEVGHLMKTVTHEDGSESRHCLRTAHAEQNAICQAAKLGIAIEGSTIYTRMTPCATCAKMIINVGIKRVVCEKIYHAGSESVRLFEDAGIKLEILDDQLEEYVDQ